MSVYEVTIPIATYADPNERVHWAVRTKRNATARDAVLVALRPAVRAGVKLPCTVELHRFGLRLLDDDNLRPALKAVRDQVAVELRLPVRKPASYVTRDGRLKTQTRLVADDRDPRVRWEYSQSQAPSPAVRIRITEVPSP